MRFLPSTRVREVLNLNRSAGKVLWTAFQIPPVPPCAGKRKVAFGPLSTVRKDRNQNQTAYQLPAVFLLRTFETTSLSEGAATRSPSHSHCICYIISQRCEKERLTDLGGWYSPDLEVVRTHKEVGKTFACKSHQLNQRSYRTARWWTYPSCA